MGGAAWSEEDVSWLASNYSTADYANMSAHLGRTKVSIVRAANSRGLKRYVGHTINHTFFGTWSAEMAYILGIVITDGCISRGKLRFGVASKDRSLLEFISSRLCPGKAIRDTNYVNSKTKRRYPTSWLELGSKQIVRDLLGHGVTERKTGREAMPNCPEEFRPDLLRGLLDGDGCFNFSRKNAAFPYIRMTIASASPEFLEEVKRQLCFGFGRIYRCSRNCFKWTLYRQKQIKKLVDIMYYEGAPFYLERKFETVMSRGWEGENRFYHRGRGCSAASMVTSL